MPVAALPEAATTAPVIGEAVPLATAGATTDALAITALRASSTQHDLDAARADEVAVRTQLAATDDQITTVTGELQSLTERAFLVPHDQVAAVTKARNSAATTKRDLEVARAGLVMQLAVADTVLDQTTADAGTARSQLAQLVVDRIGPIAVRSTPTADGAEPVSPAEALTTVWASSSSTRLDVVYAALSRVGDPYVWAAAGPDAFDCSGLTQFAWATVGVHLTHYTHAQRAETLDAEADALQPGDLIYNLSVDGTGHVMLSLGLDKLIVEAPAPGQLVKVSRWTQSTGFGSPLDDRPAAVATAVTLPAPTPAG